MSVAVAADVEPEAWLARRRARRQRIRQAAIRACVPGLTKPPQAATPGDQIAWAHTYIRHQYGEGPPYDS